MFKKGVITDEISQDLKTAIEVAVKYKLDGIEIRSVWDRSAHELDNNDIEIIKELLQNTKLEVCAISSQFFKCSINNEDEINAHMEILDKCIRLAKKLGAKFVRGFTFWKEGDFDENLPKIIEKFKKPVEMLNKTGIIMVLESDPSVFASNAGKLRKVVDGIGSPSVKALWDPGNDIYDPDGEVPYPDGYDIIKPCMVHMHLKDAVKQADGKIAGVPIGKGQVDYPGQFNALLKDGYDGYVVLETHYRPAHDISEELMLLPKGSAFSYLGKEATEECLDNWFELMSSVKGNK